MKDKDYARNFCIGYVLMILTLVVVETGGPYYPEFWGGCLFLAGGLIVFLEIGIPIICMYYLMEVNSYFPKLPFGIKFLTGILITIAWYSFLIAIGSIRSQLK